MKLPIARVGVGSSAGLLIRAAMIFISLNIVRAIPASPLAFMGGFPVEPLDKSRFRQGADPKFCVGVSWYLAVDMQLYMFVAPIVLIAWHYGFYSKVVFRFRKVIGGVLLGLLLVGSLAWTTHIVITKKVAWQFMGIGDYDSYYIMPWVRAPPYLCGLGLGLLLHQLLRHPCCRRRRATTQ